MTKFRVLLVASAAISPFLASAAHAQSAGSQEFEDAIIITGSRSKDVGGVTIPDSPKAKVQLDQELISRGMAGQTINETLNLVPGVSFTNNDPWGSLGGSFTIRGFDSSRVSQTVDGIPLNDSGNYALYTNQQPDPETLESVNVNLGSTDVDSPTASAAGGTVNMRTRDPSETFGVFANASYGNIIARGNSKDRYFMRGFVMVDTGDFTGKGTTAWFSGSATQNKSTFSNYGGVDKQQFNGKIMQDLGNGQYISIAGHYNQNRNNFNGSSLSVLTIINPGTGLTLSPQGRFYNVNYPCTIAPAVTGTKDTPNSCGSEFERRFNPSNTGNIRISSLFKPSEKLTITIEPSFQYVKANGGGTSSVNEYARIINGQAVYGYIGGSYYVGHDLNGDTDTLDTVRILTPSQTQTRRYGVIANAAYELSDLHRIRLSYTFDRARHRQTGELGLLQQNGEPFDVFPVNDPVLDVNGNRIQKRDRLSFATLNQVSGEYTGQFLNEALRVQIGARMPFFTRDLDQRCFTTNGERGFIDCISSGAATYQAANPYVYNSSTGKATGSAPPQTRTYKYDKLLPNIGAVYNFTSAVSLSANYAKNLSVPGTDDFYDSLDLPETAPGVKPVAETSDSFDLDLRYTTSIVQAQISGWYTNYQNRLAKAYIIDCDCTRSTNIGEVEKYGIDANISVRPVRPLLFYVWGSWIHSEIKSDIPSGTGSVYETAGKRERYTPEYMIGARAQLTIGGADIGFQVKRTGSRYLTDNNDPRFLLPAYTVADVDLRYTLEPLTGIKSTYFQLNVNNLFDEVYIGSASGGIATPSNNFVNIGSPRSIMGSIGVKF